MMKKSNLTLNELRLQGNNGGKSEMNKMSDKREKRTVGELSTIVLILKHVIFYSLVDST